MPSFILKENENVNCFVIEEAKVGRG